MSPLAERSMNSFRSFLFMGPLLKASRFSVPVARVPFTSCAHRVNRSVQHEIVALQCLTDEHVPAASSHFGLASNRL